MGWEVRCASPRDARQLIDDDADELRTDERGLSAIDNSHVRAKLGAPAMAARAALGVQLQGAPGPLARYPEALVHDAHSSSGSAAGRRGGRVGRVLVA
mmetsp:Transcript_2470/g.5433  ORF Transcript_2470/g.5433 Transcript_2470/m.5433 type:complete len:98 (+) Transcript_2470:196-489(+)